METRVRVRCTTVWRRMDYEDREYRYMRPRQRPKGGRVWMTVITGKMEMQRIVRGGLYMELDS